MFFRQAKGKSAMDAPRDNEKLETRLSRWIEERLGGRVLDIERQPRWRPAWYADVEVGGERRPIYVRGRREQAELLFFPLAHEAEVMRVLHDAGIPAPRIYGLCNDPEAIVMDRMPGRPNLATAADPDEAARVLLDFIDVLARMHALPPERFLGAPGLEMPADPQALALGLFERFERIYRANKRRPEPEVVFAMRWVRRNVPMHRTRPAFITCDSGQFLFDRGRVTSVLDMELAHIGDPALDLASLMLRDLSEPLGDLAPAFARYEEVTGEPIDWDVVRYYIALWGIMTPMVTGHLSKDPPPELNLPYNLDQSITLTRVPLEAIAETIGAELDPVPPMQERSGSGGTIARQAAITSLFGALADLHPTEPFEAYRKDNAEALADYLGILIEHEARVQEEEREEAAHLLGRDLPEEEERDSALEQFAATAGPEQDHALVRLFHRRAARRQSLLGSRAKLFHHREIQHPERVAPGKTFAANEGRTG
jgi:aminoglycoside phosphotransferase (APT) family kinase protein